MPATESAKAPKSKPDQKPNSAAATARAGHGESDQEFERRTTAEGRIPASGDTGATPTEVPGADAAPKGPLEAITLYKKLLKEYPQYKDSDQVLYQMARAYDELGRTEEAMQTMELVIRANPNSVHFDEVQFRRGEYFFTRRKFRDAENAFSAITNLGANSSYYELLQYKLAWTFPKLVLESKRDFASKYGLQAEYWRHNKPEELPEAIAYLKADLKDLATHYHAEYQSSQETNEKLANYHEALRWYGDYLNSFPKDAESSAINYRMADLLFENKDFGEAAKQYERTAYGYPANAQSAAAGYAAVYAYREQLKVVGKENLEGVKHDTVTSSIKFADTFPTHAQAAAVPGAAAAALYEMKDYRAAVGSAQRVIDKYPGAEMPIRRSAWIVVAHGSFELAAYPQAEKAYTQVLAVTPESDASHAKFVDNLAASIYKQGEIARDAKDYRAAADHFLRIRTAAPTTPIRATAEYDAGGALIELKDWKAAAGVLEAFRSTYPKHKMAGEATRLIARAYRESGELSHAAGEYERLASESTDEAVRRESLLVAGDLYQQSNTNDKALNAYQRYVTDFPKPLEAAVETHFKMAEIHKGSHDDALYQKELAEIVRIDGTAGPERTGRTRTLAGRSALVLAEQLYQACVAIKLRQPFETSLKEKRQRMDATIKAMSGLVDYQIADVTAAATFYMAETYFDFSRSLKESERPADMKGANLEKFEADLDEAAYPFEDKAIKVHEKNMESLHAGVFNTWTEKSLSRLAEMVPGRYAKNEMSSGFIGAIDRYVYQSPLAQAAIQAAATSNAGTTPTNGGTTPSNTSSTPSTVGTTPSNTDQTTQPTPGAGTTPSKPDATHPA